ncbi:MAG: hypothetical protein AAGB22_06285, partial [Bacteroidota bacterium]
SVSSGGSLQQPNGNASMDVLWTTLPGTVTVQVTDPLTTCTTTETMTVTQNCSAADLYMKDHPIDPGTEPGLSSGPMWTSQDIWIRNSQDPPPFAQQHVHENPVYAAGTPNYVYVKVRNRGQAASAGTEQLKLYWAKASTGLSWPTPWNGGSYFGVPPNMPKGDLIATQTIPVVAPNADVILEFPWYPEDPDSYASIFGLDKSHYCLLARIETDPLPPYGMSNAETANLHHNVQYNNNIVWKNITFVDASSGYGGSGSVLIGPLLDPTRATVLQLGLRQDEGDDFMAHGIVQLTVDGDFAKRLRADEVELKGLEWKDERTLLITGPEATLANVRLRPKEQPVLLFDFSWKPRSRVKSGKDYQFIVVQLEQDEKGARHVVGGETFLVRKPRDEEAPKKRFWLWRWLFRLFGK